MKNIDFDKMWIGAVLGFFAPFIALTGYYLINYHYMSVPKFIEYLRIGDTYTPLVSLCVLANLVAFYPFIWKEKWNGARGVIASTFIWASIVVFLKFFT